jgi:hypothetical protein
MSYHAIERYLRRRLGANLHAQPRPGRVNTYIQLGRLVRAVLENVDLELARHEEVRHELALAMEAMRRVDARAVEDRIDHTPNPTSNSQRFRRRVTLAETRSDGTYDLTLECGHTLQLKPVARGRRNLPAIVTCFTCKHEAAALAYEEKTS